MADTLIEKDRLRVVCSPSIFAFETTSDLAPLDGPVGQGIAVEAIRLSAAMRHPRFNLFVYGPEGSGRHSTVLRILQSVATSRSVPGDWVYVNNFAEPDKPLAISLPSGEAPKLRDAVAALVEDLASRIPAVLVSEDCQTRRTAIEQDFAARQEAAFKDLAESARKRNVAILRTPMGFSLAAMHESEVLNAEAMAAMAEAERVRIEADIDATHEELEDFLASLPELGREQREALAALNARKITAFALELLPRISRAQSMDALSSQGSCAGYQCGLIAAARCTKFFPMLTTAAGTIRPARVLVIGAGVAGLQAIATCKRLGAMVEAYDVRAAAKEQIESLGAKFVDTGVSADGAGGYARELTAEEKAAQTEKLAKAVAMSDVVITTAAIPGKKAPVIITVDMIKRMKYGAIIVDMAAESGGNCALTQPGEHVVANDVNIHGPLNLPSRMPTHASELYAKNLYNFLSPWIKDGNLQFDWSDEVVAGTLLCKDGATVHATVKQVMGEA